MNALYIPQAGSLAARVCAFFVQHRDEELSARDIAQKFDTATSGVTAQLAAAVAHGLLAHAKDETGTRVFVAGPKLGQHPTSPMATTRAPRARRSVAPLPAPEDLRIEPGVPLPPQRASRRRQFDDLFARMGVGDSVACAAAAGKRLAQAANAYGKPLGRKFALRATTADQARIWRTQ